MNFLSLRNITGGGSVVMANFAFCISLKLSHNRNMPKPVGHKLLGASLLVLQYIIHHLFSISMAIFIIFIYHVKNATLAGYSTIGVEHEKMEGTFSTRNIKLGMVGNVL
jgi:hypothetical protein